MRLSCDSKNIVMRFSRVDSVPITTQLESPQRLIGEFSFKTSATKQASLQLKSSFT